MASVAIVSDSTTVDPGDLHRVAPGRQDRGQRLGVQHPLVQRDAALLDLALVLVDHLAVGRGGPGVDGRLGQHGADGLDRLAALVHFLEGLLGVVGVDRVARLA